MRLLVNHVEKSNVLNNAGKSCLYIAAERNNHDYMFKEMKPKSPLKDIDVLDRIGLSALLLAIKGRHQRTVNCARNFKVEA